MAFLGLFVAVIFIFFRIERFNLTFIAFLKMLTLCILFGFLGSRIVYFISRIPWIINNFSIFNILSNSICGGFVFYGGLFGVLYGCKLFCKKNNLDVKIIYSMITPAIPLFHAFGRMGCFMAGCCYGLELQHPINVFNILTLNRIPTQIIEVIFEMSLFIVILILEKKTDKIDYLKAYLISYAVFRFVIEFFRGDAVRGLVCGISTSQFISIGILVFYILRKFFKKRIKTETSKLRQD